MKYRITAQRTAEEIVRAIVGELHTHPASRSASNAAAEVVESLVAVVTEIIIQNTRPKGAQ